MLSCHLRNQSALFRLEEQRVKSCILRNVIVLRNAKAVMKNLLPIENQMLYAHEAITLICQLSITIKFTFSIGLFRLCWHVFSNPLSAEQDKCSLYIFYCI